MEVEVNGKKYEVKELTYLQALELGELGKSEMAKKLLQLSVGLSDEDISKLTIKEGIELQNAVNKVNNLEDFQNPTEEQNQN